MRKIGGRSRSFAPPGLARLALPPRAGALGFILNSYAASRLTAPATPSPHASRQAGAHMHRRKPRSAPRPTPPTAIKASVAKATHRSTRSTVPRAHASPPPESAPAPLSTRRELPPAPAATLSEAPPPDRAPRAYSKPPHRPPPSRWLRARPTRARPSPARQAAAAEVFSDCRAVARGPVRDSAPSAIHSESAGTPPCQTAARAGV